MYLLGYDIGSSSVKASLVDAETGKCVASDFFPKNEAPIIAHEQGWAEQDPSMWLGNLKLATASVLEQAKGISPRDIKAIGISYQMHGLVCVDRDMNVLRPSIIWCDSRAVPFGQKAFQALGEEYCLGHLLNSPGNFTAAKLAWVKENEPDPPSHGIGHRHNAGASPRLWWSRNRNRCIGSCRRVYVCIIRP